MPQYTCLTPYCHMTDSLYPTLEKTYKFLTLNHDLKVLNLTIKKAPDMMTL